MISNTTLNRTCINAVKPRQPVNSEVGLDASAVIEINMLWPIEETEMAKGFEIELSNGAILRVVPNVGVDNCVITHGDSKIEINVKNVSFRIVALAGKAITSIPAVVRFEITELTVTDCVESGNKKGTHTLSRCYTTAHAENRPHCLLRCPPPHHPARQPPGKRFFQ